MASLPLVTVTGTIFNVDGVTEYTGPVTVEQPVTLRHTDGTVMLSGSRTINVVDGAFSAQIAFCDAPGWAPDGSAAPTRWNHKLSIPAGSTTRVFSLFASVDDTDTVNLGDIISQGYTPPAGQQYAPVNHTHADLQAQIDETAELLQPENGLDIFAFTGYKNSPGAPITGSWVIGDTIMAQDGLWRCVASGTPGSWLAISHAELNRLTSVGETAVNRLRPTGQVALADRQMVLTFFMGLETKTVMSFGTTMPNTGLATGSTHSWVGIYKLIGANLVPDAVSVDDPSKWTAQGAYDTPIFDPAHPGEGGFQGWNEIAGQVYAGAFLWRGGGNAPQLPGAVIWGTEAGFLPRLNGYLPAQDFPPTAPFPLSNVLDDFRLIQAHLKR